MIRRSIVTVKLYAANLLLRWAGRLGLPPVPVGLATRRIEPGELVRQGDLMLYGLIVDGPWIGTALGNADAGDEVLVELGPEVQ